MVNSCCVCKRRFAKDSGISFYRFPKDDMLRSMWLAAIRRVNFTLKSHSRICSKHFEKSCFGSRFGQSQLRAAACPTIFDVTHVPKKRKNKRRTLKKYKSEDISNNYIESQERLSERSLNETGGPVTDINKAKGNKLLKGSISLNLKDHVSTKQSTNRMITKIQEEDNEFVPTEYMHLPMDIKAETIKELSNDPELLAQERMVIVDIVKNIMGSLDLLVKSDPDSLRSTNVRIKILEALYCYHQIVDDKDLNLAFCKDTDIFNNDNQPPKKIVTEVNFETKEEIGDTNIPNEDYEDIEFLSDEENFSNDEHYKEVHLLNDEENFLNDEYYEENYLNDEHFEVVDSLTDKGNLSNDEHFNEVDFLSDEEDPEWESIKILKDQIENKKSVVKKSRNPTNKKSSSNIKRYVPHRLTPRWEEQ